MTASARAVRRAVDRAAKAPSWREAARWLARATELAEALASEERCSCRLPARSPRASGPDVCATCKRPIGEEAG